MPWQCRLIDEAERRRLAIAGNGSLPPGTLYYADPSMVDSSDPFGDFYLKTMLSAEYMRDWLGKRLPLFIALPSGGDLCLDFAYTYTRGKSRQGWTITGDPPNITAFPSINAIGSYHGWLSGGVLSDDVEGRRY